MKTFWKGWANSNSPDLVFKSFVSKNKDVKSANSQVFVGNKLKDFDFLK